MNNTQCPVVTAAIKFERMPSVPLSEYIGKFKTMSQRQSVIRNMNYIRFGVEGSEAQLAAKLFNKRVKRLGDTSEYTLTYMKAGKDKTGVPRNWVMAYNHTTKQYSKINFSGLAGQHIWQLA